MTLKEKVVEEAPENVGDEYIGGVYGCPDWECYDYLYACRPDFCCSYQLDSYGTINTEKICRRCWDRGYIHEEQEEMCPICDYSIDKCQCLYGGECHPERGHRLQIVLDHLYLLNEAQIRHIIDVEKNWQISYSDSQLTHELESLRSKKENND